MRKAILLCIFLPLAGGFAQNVSIKQIPGMLQYEHEFIAEHRLGDFGEEKYPHVHMYCRSNDSSLMVFKLFIERKGATAIADEKTIPVLITDGDSFKSNSVKYEQFPMKDGVLETFEFYAPSLIMEALANSDDVKIDIGGAVYDYPYDMRGDYRELHRIVYTRNKQSLIEKEEVVPEDGLE
jgi:hypothetical protein